MSEEKKDRFVISGTLKVSRELVHSLVISYLAEQENVKPLLEKVEKEHGNIGFWWTDPAKEAKLPNGQPLGIEIVFGKEENLSDEETKERELHPIDAEGYFCCSAAPGMFTDHKEPEGILKEWTTTTGSV